MARAGTGATSSRSSGAATSWRALSTALDRTLERAREHRRHLGRGGPRQVAARRRVRARGPRRRRPRRLRRVPGVRHERRLLRLAGDLADACSASTRASAEEEQRLALERALEAIDPALVQRAPLLGPAARNRDPGERPHRLLRRQAAQDVARGPARGVPARQGGRRARRDRARGLPLDRPAGARPARPLSSAASAALPVLFVLAYRPAAEPGGGLGIEQLPQFVELELGRARARRRRAPRSAPSSRSCSAPTRPRRHCSSSSSRRARRATRSTSRSCSTTSTATASIPRTRRRCASSSCPRACTA